MLHSARGWAGPGRDLGRLQQVAFGTGVRGAEGQRNRAWRRPGLEAQSSVKPGPEVMAEKPHTHHQEARLAGVAGEGSSKGFPKVLRPSRKGVHASRDGPGKGRALGQRLGGAAEGLEWMGRGGESARQVSQVRQSGQTGRKGRQDGRARGSEPCSRAFRSHLPGAPTPPSL